MNNREIIDIMQNRLSKSDKRLLKSIWAPQVVAVPPTDARRGICVMEDGEIRHYGEIDKKNAWDKGKPVYISSCDCGLSWKMHYVEDEGTLGACAASIHEKLYMTIKSFEVPGNNVFSVYFKPDMQNNDEVGTYAFISRIGADDPSPKKVKISDRVFSDSSQPFNLNQKNRWICAAHEYCDGSYHPVVMLSDNGGEDWRYIDLKSAPRFEASWPHKGVRWENNGSEPTVAELSDGTLLMLARTSNDYFYKYYSYDGGETWTEPVQSEFHGTLTTPMFTRLSDGRVILFWCNTQPLPELDHSKQWPPLNDATKSGMSEDVFTNRDANHAAITEDNGKTWIGFREMFLNPLRNDCDYRSKGGLKSSADRSVHQYQAIELPYGKLLVSFGQHEIMRKMVIFDVNWLYEKERKEDFSCGLANVSTQVFLKSVSGDDCPFENKIHSGHCSWNRTNGAVLAPDPDGTHEDVLFISTTDDNRLVSNVQGAVWNFPSARHGELLIRIRVVGEGVSIALADHWFNPIDTSVSVMAQCAFALTRDMTEPDGWTDIRLVWDSEAGELLAYANDRRLFTKPFQQTAPHGISYLHIQGLSRAEDSKGAYIKYIEQHSI